MRKFKANYYALFLVRMVILYLVFMMCRVAFAIYNWDIISPVSWSDLPSILKGSFVFDSASILYVNGVFVLMTFLPHRVRGSKGYQRVLMGIYVGINSLALIINIADIYYFPFKLSRIASDDLHFLSGGNVGALMGRFLVDYWSGILLWLGCVVVLCVGFKFTGYKPIKNRVKLNTLPFVLIQFFLIALIAGFSIFAIRGFNTSKASYPINMSDASLYVKPKYASLVLSNPFCLIRTAGQKQITYSKYFDDQQLDKIYSVEHQPIDEPAISIDNTPNIVLLVMESFGSAQLKSFSDQFGENDVSFSPFIDSLVRESYVFTNAFQNGMRSIDVMPALWSSIPTFKIQFLSLPNSVAQYRALPSCLAQMGYNTMFLHGAVRESMGFVSFGQMAGVEQFYTRESYEAEHGSNDSDGTWGIWDHKFMPFVGEKLAEAKEPFMATIFTLSSHHPYLLPAEFQNKFPKGKHPIQETIAYSDYAISEFFREAAKQEWFNNTLFILTADHGSTADNEKYRQTPFAHAVPIIMHYTGNHLTVNGNKTGILYDAPALVAKDMALKVGLDGNHIVQGDNSQGSRPKLIGRNQRTTQHIDLMPTLLHMLGYQEPFFAFGRDVFNNQDAGFAINYYGSAFNYMRDSIRYVFNEQEVVGVYNYRLDYMSEDNIEQLTGADSLSIRQMKAFIQQYYRHVRERAYTVERRQMLFK